MGSASVGIYAGLIFVVLLVLALALFAAPLFALLIAAMLIALAAVLLLVRRAGGKVPEPGTRQSDAVTPEGKATPPTGRGSGAPASGEN